MKKGNNNFYEEIKEENIESFKFYLNNSLTKLQKDIFNLRYDKKGNILFEIEEIASKYNTTVDNINIILNIIFKTKKRILDKDFRPNTKYYTPKLRKTYKKELIKTINTLHRLPNKIENNISEALFIDGTDQRFYYDSLKSKAKRVIAKKRKNEDITEEEQNDLDDYTIIQEALNNQLKNNAKKTSEEAKEKIQMIITSYINNSEKRINKSNHRYVYLKKIHKEVTKKINNNEQLTIKEIQRNTDYNAIYNVLSFFPQRVITNQMLVDLFCKTNHINTTINKDMLKKAFYEIYIKIKFLIENNIPVINNDGTINQIIYLSDINLQKKYNITIEELAKKYITGSVNSNEASKTLVL